MTTTEYTRIFADLLYEDVNTLDPDCFVDLYNAYVDNTGHGQLIYNMNEFDDELGYYSPSEIVQMVEDGDFRLSDYYFTVDEYCGVLTSFDEPDCDTEEIVEWMIQTENYLTINEERIKELKAEILRVNLENKLIDMLAQFEDNLAVKLEAELIEEEPSLDYICDLNNARMQYVNALMKNLKLNIEDSEDNENDCN